MHKWPPGLGPCFFTDAFTKRYIILYPCYYILTVTSHCPPSSPLCRRLCIWREENNQSPIDPAHPHTPSCHVIQSADVFRYEVEVRLGNDTLLVLLRTNGGGGGRGFACTFLLPVLPAMQRRLPSIIRPHWSTASASLLSPSWGPPPGLHHIRSICMPVSIEAASMPLSLLSPGCFRKGVSTSLNKKKPRTSLSSSKSYKSWIGRYMHNPKHLCSGFRVAYVCYSHSSPWWYWSDHKVLINSIGVLGLIGALGSDGEHHLLEQGDAA